MLEEKEEENREDIIISSCVLVGETLDYEEDYLKHIRTNPTTFYYQVTPFQTVNTFTLEQLVAVLHFFRR